MSGYTLIIGTCNWSSWSLRPYLALKATGEPFELVKVALRQTKTKEEILRHSPSGRVPALTFTQDGQRFTIWDSLAICETLAERHPQALLWPAEKIARATARAYACEMHSGFADLRDQLSMEFVRTTPMPQLREETTAQIARILCAWQEALARYGGPFLFGQFSIADCMYAPVVSRFTTYSVPVASQIQTYMERIWELAAMKEWHQFAETELKGGELHRDGSGAIALAR